MSVILNIDTATENAYISISKEGIILSEAIYNEQRDHGKFLHPGIQELIKKASISIEQLDAISVAAGPGSYTGLRVGMATAKGLCYGLNKPLIAVGTLEILALAAITATGIKTHECATLFCPMIDARRMEVFTALYDPNMQLVLEPVAMILDESSFANMLLKNQIRFVGSGAKKWELICTHQNAVFTPVSGNLLAMSTLAYRKYVYNDFTDLAYSEPLYLKEFFGGPART